MRRPGVSLIANPHVEPQGRAANTQKQTAQTLLRQEIFDDADLDWYDYGFRNYDAQIGRFTQLYPLTWDYPELTNYQMLPMTLY